MDPTSPTSTGRPGVLIVRADLFSGRENVSWMLGDDSETHEILRKLTSRRSALAPSGLGQPRLGFRGLHVRLTDDSLPNRYELPAAFRLAGGGSSDEGTGLEIAEQLVAGMPLQKEAFVSSAEGDEDFRKTLLAAMREGPETPRPRDRTGASPGGWPLVNSVLAEGAQGGAHTEATTCPYTVAPYEPTVWQQWPTMQLNNCYNYACNKITDTIAQPGRASGAPYATATCQNVVSAALRDGNHYAGDCFPPGTEGLWLMGLCVWPGVDYHFYRLMDSGFWTHKPSILAVTPFDDCGNLILDPEDACRGPYNQWCGYIQTSSTVQIR